MLSNVYWVRFLIETYGQNAKEAGLRKRGKRKRREKKEKEEANFKSVFSSNDLASFMGSIKPGLPFGVVSH